MHLGMLVDMIDSGFEDRVLLVHDGRAYAGAEVAALARRGAAGIAGRGSVVYVGENHGLLPVALLAAAVADIPFVPINYRLEDRQLRELIALQHDALVLTDVETLERLDGHGGPTLDDWLHELPAIATTEATIGDGGDVAVVLYTSGTTSAPKAALLRHRHLMSYLLATVEFGSASPDEAVLIAVPPYHVAGVVNMLSNLFAGRRLVYLPAFDASRWLEVARGEHVTNAMVVPTMLSRIVEAIGEGPADLPDLRTLSYGGSKVSERVVTQALRLLPGVGFVNAYGLTETASTIALLGPDDHRAALASEDPGVRRRLASVGQVLPTVEVEIRDERGATLPAGETGLVFVRGEQIAGEYASGSVLDDAGWFCTRDRGFVDAAGYLFIEGRADDTIIRGGENIAPAEIEEVLLAHPAVKEACVVGMPDEEWGQRIAAVVVAWPGTGVDATMLRDAVRSKLRGARTPDTIVFREALPHTDTGKLLRRVVLDDLLAAGDAACN
ncbi:MAG TPA: fatty acid--CoA ligase family protein [Ilumatobacter sp.]|nr:fatty acid--CoA ligase family protein [Ilumatobacter sp.]